MKSTVFLVVLGFAAVFGAPPAKPADKKVTKRGLYSGLDLGLNSLSYSSFDDGLFSSPIISTPIVSNPVVHTNTVVTKHVPVPVEVPVVHKVAVPVPTPIEVTRHVPVPIVQKVAVGVPVHSYSYSPISYSSSLW